MAKKKRIHHPSPMYVELHAASAFSFLRASSLPEDLVERAAELGYPALALVDRDGLTGAPRFFKAARAAGVRPIVGAELTLAGGGSLPLLVESRVGYRNLCRLITGMKRGVPKGEGALALAALTRRTVEGLVALAGVEALGRRPTPSGWRDCCEAFGPGNVVDRRPAPSPPRAGGREPGPARPRRRARPRGRRHERRAPRARPAAAPCSTSSPASARSARWPTPAGCWPRTPSAT